MSIYVKVHVMKVLLLIDMEMNVSRNVLKDITI